MATLSSKALPTGLATSAQGALADTALQPTGDGSGLTGVSPHKPVAVSGTTPSLNVGSYNFFDSGTLTGDTTLAFASVPTNANWRYKFKPVTLTGSWDVSTAAYTQTFSVSAQANNPQGVFFKPDGLKMYAVSDVGDDVSEYDLSTAWDISTAVYLQSFSIVTQESNSQGLFFKPDGLKMYVLGYTEDKVIEYDISTAWDISTATYGRDFSVISNAQNPTDVFFKPDGLKMYVTSNTGTDVNEYNLSTAWLVTTAVYSQNLSVSAQANTPSSVFFKPDGLKMYVLSLAGDDVNEYDLSTAWDISTAVYLQAHAVASEESVPQGLFFKPDGLKMYVVGQDVDAVVEYNVGSPTSLTLPASLQNAPALALVNDTDVLYEFVTDDAGVTVTLISEEII